MTPPAAPGPDPQARLQSSWDHLSEAERAEIREQVKHAHPYLRRHPQALQMLCLEVLRERLGIPDGPDEPEAGDKKRGAPAAPVFPDWSEPLLDGPGPAPPFPLDLLPAPLADFIAEAARTFPSPPDYFAVPALAIAGAAVGRSVALAVKDTWAESPLLFAATVGPPGSVKSPALKLMTWPVWRIAAERKEEYDAECAADAARRREARELAKSAKKGGKAADPEPEGPRPKLRRVVAEDITCESSARVLSENPRGLLVVHDELSGWINAMNQYKGGSGSDRQFWLKIWAGSPIVVDRVANENNVPIVVPHPFQPVAGAITPDMLDGLSEGENDGFVDRILFSFPDPIRTRWTWRAVREQGPAAWEAAVRRLWARPLLGEEGEERPAFVRFTRPALHRYARWFDGHQRETEAEEFPRHLVGPWAKYRAYCARLALILDQVHWAYDENSDPGAPPRDVGLAAVEGAIRLVDDYFKPHFRRALAALRPDRADNPDARAVLDWAVRRGRKTFTAKAARDNFRRRFDDRPEDFPAALRWLCARGAVRLVVLPFDRDRSRGGRLPSDSYEVNPHLLIPGQKVRSAK